jgi:hypothetical protein
MPRRFESCPLLLMCRLWEVPLYTWHSTKYFDLTYFSSSHFDLGQCSIQIRSLACFVTTGTILLLQRSLLPGGIILQGVLLLQGSMSVLLWLGANWGYWPSDSVFDQGGGVHHKLLMFFTWMGSFACHWHYWPGPGWWQNFFCHQLGVNLSWHLNPSVKYSTVDFMPRYWSEVNVDPKFA